MPTQANQDVVAGIIQRTYQGALERTVLEISPAWQRFKALNKIKYNPNVQVRWPIVDKAYAAATNIKDGEDLPESGVETYAFAQLDFSIFIGLVRVGRLLQYAQSGNDIYSPQAVSLLDEQVKAAIEQNARNMHLQLVQQTAGAKQLVGLGDAIGKDDNAYAGIDRTVTANFAPLVLDNGGVNRALTEALLTTTMDTLRYARGANIDEAWCGLGAFRSLAALLGGDARIRQLDPSNLKGGAVSIEYEGVNFIKMPNQKTNCIRFLDMSSISIEKQHPGDQDFIVAKENTNSYDDRYSIAGHYQLKVGNPFRQGTLDDLA